MRFKVDDPKDPSSDRFVLSKGHAAPALYAVCAEAGLLPIASLNDLRKFESDLEGHPKPSPNNIIDVATGSLGQGISIACGMALVGKNFDRASYRVYCLLGDGETAEGSVWEALQFAVYYKLDNLCVIIDVNGLGQSRSTYLGTNCDEYKARLSSFGFHAIIVNGHDVKEVAAKLAASGYCRGQPTAIIARTVKGKHFPQVENQVNWHGKPLGEYAKPTIEHLKKLLEKDGHTKLRPLKPLTDDCSMCPQAVGIKLITEPDYTVGEQVATRRAYGSALVKLARAHPGVIALDADVKNSTFSELMMDVDRVRHIECFIAEQNMVGVAVGCAVRNRTIPFVSTFAAFLTRAFDQIRMAAISQSKIVFVGSHAGVTIGEDGPSQMGLEDIAMFRTIPNSTLFYPSDAVSTERVVEMAVNLDSITYIRTTRPATPVIYSNDYNFVLGQPNVLRHTSSDEVVVISAGAILHEVLRAADILADMMIHVRVLDLFTVKPISKQAIIDNATKSKGRIMVVEDHYYEGGIGEAIMATVADQRNIIVKHLAVPMIPRSGAPHILLDACGINYDHIVKQIKLFRKA